MVGTFTQCECEKKPVKFPDTGTKILSEVPTPGYSAITSQSLVCIESAVTAFLKSPHHTLKSISIKWRQHGRTSYSNNLCQMFKLPSGVKMQLPTNQIWMPRSSPGLLGEASIHPSPLGKTNWWIWSDYPHFFHTMPGWGGGFKWLVHKYTTGKGW